MSVKLETIRYSVQCKVLMLNTGLRFLPGHFSIAGEWSRLE